MTVIDSLLVTLGLDAKKFVDGQAAAGKSMVTTGKASETLKKDVQRHTDQAGDAVKKLRNEALTLLGVFTAGMGLKDFFASTVLSTASLGRMSANLNMSAKDLAEWELAAKRMGATAAQMDSQLQESQMEAANAAQGRFGDKEKWFQLYGGDVKDLRDGNTFLLARAKIVEQIFRTKGADAAALAGQQMGLDPGLFNLFKMGPDAIERLRASMAGLAEEQARMSAKAEELRQRWDDLQNRLSKIALTQLEAFWPLIKEAMTQLERLSKWVDDHHADISRWIHESIAAIREFVIEVNKGVESIGGWKTVLEALIALKILTVVTPLISLAAALTSVGTALGGIGAATAGLGVLAELASLVAERGPIWLLFHSEELNQGESDDPRLQRSTTPKERAKFAEDAQKDPQTSGVVNKLIGMGWTRQQASGIAANLYAESKYDPKAIGDGGQAYGIGQWHPDRQAWFNRIMKKPIQGSTLDEQLAFANWELTQGPLKGAGDHLKNAKGEAEAGEIVSREFERPGATKFYQDQAAMNRAAAAAAIYSNSAIGSAAAAAQGPAAPVNNRGGDTHHSTTEIKVDTVTVQTQATDADGIARDMRKALTDAFGPWQANTGM